MRILLLGKHGQLGWELQRTLAALGAITAVDFEDFDLAAPDVLRQRVHDLRPEVIVNAAAYTNVDGAESEPRKARAINAVAPQILAEQARALDAALIHYSTDYIFDGVRGIPYKEEDTPNPLNTYGKSKLAGEQAIQAVGGTYLILRTAWVYSLRGNGFVTKVMQWARQNETLSIVDDQISNPTWARMLAEVTGQILSRGSDAVRGHAGLYHLAGGGYASRYEWARRILELDPRRHEQAMKQLVPARTDAFPTPARRPLFSALDCQKFEQAFDLRLPHWSAALEMALEPNGDFLKGGKRP